MGAIRMKNHYGLVLMIDALGVSRYTLDECKKFLTKRKEIEDHLRTEKDLFGRFSPHYKNSQMSVFGDTIVFCMPVSKKKNSEDITIIQDIAADAGIIIQWGIENGILFRGCISIGDYISERNTILGPAIFDAHDWYESANWFGIIFTPKTQIWIESILEREKSRENIQTTEYLKLFSEIVHLYDVPISSNSKIELTKRFWTVGWPYWYYHRIEEEKIDETPREILLKQLFEISESKEGESKFKNGIDYFDWYRKKFGLRKAKKK